MAADTNIRSRGHPCAAVSSQTMANFGNSGTASPVLLGQMDAEKPLVGHGLPELLRLPATSCLLNEVVVPESGRNFRSCRTEELVLGIVHEVHGP